jgi:hypothetical protein
LLMASKQPLQNRLKRNGEQAASIISPTWANELKCRREPTRHNEFFVVVVPVRYSMKIASVIHHKQLSMV